MAYYLEEEFFVFCFIPSYMGSARLNIFLFQVSALGLVLLYLYFVVTPTFTHHYIVR